MLSLRLAEGKGLKPVTVATWLSLLGRAQGTHRVNMSAQVLFDESIDADNTMTNGGGSINADVLPRNGSNGCKSVYPWQYPRVNNIFEVQGSMISSTAQQDLTCRLAVTIQHCCSINTAV